MQKKVFLTLMMVVALVAVGGSFSNRSRTVDAQDDVLKIGILTDQTSPLAFYGFEQQRGFEMGLDYATGGTREVAGRKIEIVLRDNAGNVDTATADARALVEEEGVEILFGSVSSTVTLNLQAIAPEYEIVYFAGPAAAPQITGTNFNEYTFRVCRNTWQDAFTAASYTVETFGPNYIVVASDNAFGQGTAAAFSYALAKSGGVPVRDNLFIAADTTDFTPALTEVLNSEADFVIVIWAGTTGVTLVNQAKDLGIFDKMGFLQGTDTNYHVALGNLAIEDTAAYIVYHYTLPDNEVNDWMVTENQARYPMPEVIANVLYPDGNAPGEVPGLFTECGFATAQAIVAALESTGGDTSAEVLIPALEGLTFNGPKGEYRIRPEDHQALVPMYIIETKPEAERDPAKPFDYFTLIEEISAEAALPICDAPAERSSEELTCGPLQ